MVYRILKNNCIHNTTTVNKTKIVKGRTNEKNISDASEQICTLVKL